MRSLLIILAACGGSGSHAEKPKPPPEKPDTYWEWHKSEPKSPEQPLRTTKFQPPQQCGQGPYRLTVETLSSQLTESMHVTICTPRGFKGSVSYVPPQHSKSESGFGDEDQRNDRCRADATIVATQGTTTSGGGTGNTGSRGKAAPATPAKVQPVELRGEVVVTGEKCPAGMSTVPIVNHGYSVGDEPGPSPSPPLPKGPFVIEIWSALPNDLTGVSFLVEQRGVPAGYDRQSWIAYRTAWNDWYKRRDEALAQAIANGHQWKTVERPAATKQPPPARAESQPPRPSPNAAWIPGYWQFADGWVWSAGFWRVPQQDIEQEKTVEAPKPPPPPRTEQPPSSEVAYHQTRRAVWTPGYWMWNGSGYVWIAGAWRIPEGVEMTWQPPTWRPSRRGTSIYVPGGFVRIRTRR